MTLKKTILAHGHSGSHDQKFESRINAAGNLELGKPLFSTESDWEQFSLRRLHSKHPTNAKFRRIISFITGEKPIVHGHYINLLGGVFHRARKFI